MWYLIVSIPDLCTLAYFENSFLRNYWNDRWYPKIFSCINPYRPGVLFVVHWQTLQTQIRGRRTQRLVGISTVSLQSVPLKFEWKWKIPPYTPKIGNERVLLIRVWGSIRLTWAKPGIIRIRICMLSFDLSCISFFDKIGSRDLLFPQKLQVSFFLCNSWISLYLNLSLTHLSINLSKFLFVFSSL